MKHLLGSDFDERRCLWFTGNARSRLKPFKKNSYDGAKVSDTLPLSLPATSGRLSEWMKRADMDGGET
jgi:hypothetical protein